MKGFSARNLKYMRAFAEAYPDEQIVQQLVAQIPWGHNVRILDAVKDALATLWYVQKTIENGWNRKAAKNANLEVEIRRNLQGLGYGN